MMDFRHYPVHVAKAKWAEEIERAVANAKRTPEDKRFRREWWRAGAGTGRGWRGWRTWRRSHMLTPCRSGPPGLRE